VTKNSNQRARGLKTRTTLARIGRARENREAFWRNAAAIGPAALKYGCMAWGCSKAADVLIAWTGADTKADVKLNVATDLLSEPEMGLLLPWVLLGVVWVLYRRERKQKESSLDRLEQLSRKYELASGARRTSGRLPHSVRDNPQDMS